jgi:FkbM family methyltransferase
MTTKIIKDLALSAVAAGFKVPEQPICRYLELLHLKQLLDLLDINCVLDIGANKGQFARELRRIGYREHIISFEPVHREFSILKKTFESDSKWQGYQFALGSANGTAEMNVIRNMTVMSSILKPLGKQADLEVEQVEVRCLDELFSHLVSGIRDPRVFLKMDTQGYDLEVFKGAHSSIRNILGLQSEISVRPLYQGMPHYLEALSVYEEAGFELFDLTVVSRVSEGSLLELNCFMKRRNS